MSAIAYKKVFGDTLPEAADRNIRNAKDLAEHLSNNVLGYEPLTTADILDALAILGLALSDSEFAGGLSSLSYQRLLS